MSFIFTVKFDLYGICMCVYCDRSIMDFGKSYVDLSSGAEIKAAGVRIPKCKLRIFFFSTEIDIYNKISHFW